MEARIHEQISRQPPERFVLTFGILVGVLTAVLLATRLPSGSEVDFHAYYFAGRAVNAGEPFVGWAITEGSFLTGKAYVYAPITAPLFSFYGFIDSWQVAYVIHTGFLLLTFYLLGRITVTYIENNGRELPRIDRWLILGFCMFSGPAVLGLYRGNVDPFILILIVAGFLAVERGREATGGALWAIAALFKLFPAFLGVWLLYRRAYRGIAAALGVGLGAMALSVLVFGMDVNVEFVEFILHERSREGAFLGGLDPTKRWITLRRPLSQFLSLSGNQLSIVAIVVVAPVVFYLYRNIETNIDRLVAFFGTFIAVLITVIPLTTGYVVYLLFPLVPLAYLVTDRGAKACFLGGLVLINVPLFPQHIEQILTAMVLSAETIETIMDIVLAVLTYVSVPLWAFLLGLTGCVLYVRAEANR